jgi:ADP-ribosylglycohydrolase
MVVRGESIRGGLYGLALGDAIAAPTEFLTVEAILARFPPDGPTQPAGTPALVTDDTQMALAVGEAIVEAVRDDRELTPSTLEGPLVRAFVAWSRSPDNTRAPGITCLKACGRLGAGIPWVDATEASSKGCGANMRVAPVGLLQSGRWGVDERTRSAIAQFQAALTHGHPTALAASDLTAAAIADLASGGDPNGLVARLRDYAVSQRSVYHDDWLGGLWKRPHMMGEQGYGPEAFIARGWAETIAALDRVEAALGAPAAPRDPCVATGAGWIAEEAFATGLFCFLLDPDDPVAVVRRAAVTSGDSDSIACLAGAFAGARNGVGAWPRDWVERVEYSDRLERLSAFLEAV